MAEYYPLLAKAIGSLPNSTPETRRVVYERARKALIGQLRTLHPPLPDAEIDNESVALDRAIERLESEIAQAAPAAAPSQTAPAQTPSAAPASPSDVTRSGRPAAAPAPKPAMPPSPAPSSAEKPSRPSVKTTPKTSEARAIDKPIERPKPPVPRPPAPAPKGPNGDAVAKPPAPPTNGTQRTPTSPSEKPAISPLRTRPAKPKVDVTDETSAGQSEAAVKETAPPPASPASGKPGSGALVPPTVPVTPPAGAQPTLVPPGGSQPPGLPTASTLPGLPSAPPPGPTEATSGGEPTDSQATVKPSRLAPQRPIAPQAPLPAQPKRRLWIIPLALVVVFGAVGYAAYKLRDRPETLTHGPTTTTPTQPDSSKIAQRVGGAPADTNAPAQSPTAPAQPANRTAAPVQAPTTTTQQKPAQPAAPGNANPDLPIGYRAALLVEAPNEQDKVKTFLGQVVWKLNNAPQGQTDSVSLAVEADIDLPDDKMKAIVTFTKNTDPSLPASHTISIRFMPEPGSYSGDVKQISVPQMRAEANPSGDPLAGVTVPIISNSFLVGLSPGADEAANVDLMRRQQWVDIPMLLSNNRIAKLTFEKGEAGQRDMNDALDAWSRQ
jgi:hypothetical protein